MIDQTRISELRRIYGGSNNEAYRTVNQLLDEIERLNDRVIILEGERESLYQANNPTVLDLSNIPIQTVTRIDEVSIEQPTEDIQLTELTEEIAQRVIEPKESNDDSKPTKATRKARKTASTDDGAKTDNDG